MNLITVFFSTFFIVFIGELGDKTQIAAGTGTLANRRQVGAIFLGSCLGLVTVSALTVFFAGLIPKSLIPTLSLAGGILLFLYGIYLFLKAGEVEEEEEEITKKNFWGLLFSQFLVVFLAELGDKTQFFTLGAAIKNQSELPIVFVASASALVAVTGITVLLAASLPASWIARIQRIGAVLMMSYGIYMIVQP